MAASLRVSDVLNFIEEKAPSTSAEKWDNVGLLIGDSTTPLTGVVVADDLTVGALQAAVDQNCHLIVTHHPCIFPKGTGLNRLVSGRPELLSSLMLKAMRQGISILACHTNFDVCCLEVPQQVSEALDFKPIGRFLEKKDDALLKKLVVFVPASHIEPVRTALCEAGAGTIGAYDHCTFQVTGTGTFRGAPGTRPHVGKPGQLEQVAEIRLETVFPRGLEHLVLKALFNAHPYEEVAFDIYPVQQSPAVAGLCAGFGYGVFGDFSGKVPFSEVAHRVKRLFNLDGYWVSHPVPEQVKRVGFVAGKGSSFVAAAASQGCDLLITGEAGYHAVLEGVRRGMTVMEIGHRESERLFLKSMEKWILHLGLRAVIVDEVAQTMRSWSDFKQEG